MEQLSSAEKHSDMRIVPAAVHHAIDLAFMLPLHQLLNQTMIAYCQREIKAAQKHEKGVFGTWRGSASMSARRATIGGEPEPMSAMRPVLAKG